MTRPLLTLAAFLLLAPCAAAVVTGPTPDRDSLRLHDDGTAYRYLPDCFGSGWEEGRWEIVGDGLIRVVSVEWRPSELRAGWVEGGTTTVVRAVDENGGALPGTTVTFDCPGGRVVRATDAEGSVSVDCLPRAATFHLDGFKPAAWRSGGQPANRLTAVLPIGNRVDFDELWTVRDAKWHLVGDRVPDDGSSVIEAGRLPRPRLATVRAFHDFRPLAGAAVLFRCDRSDVEATTDRFGEAEADDCLAAAVEVSHAGFLPIVHEVETEGDNLFTAHLAVDLAAPDERLLIDLGGRLYVNGDAFAEADPWPIGGRQDEESLENTVTVVDRRTEAPIPEARVTFHCEAGPVEVTTDADGEVRLAACAVSGVEVTAEGYRPVRYGVEVGAVENVFEVRLVRDVDNGWRAQGPPLLPPPAQRPAG